MSDESQPTRGGVAGMLSRHPVLTAIFLLCTGIGIALGVLYLPPDWALARRIAGGAFAGAGVALFLTVTRLFD